DAEAFAAARTGIRHDPEKAILHFPSFPKAIDDPHRVRVDGNREAAGRLAAVDGGAGTRQTDHLAAEVEESPATATEIEAGIGLEQDGMNVQRNLLPLFLGSPGSPA